MRILFLGDVVGRVGRDSVVAALPGLRAALRVDCAIVNGENASHGFGLAPDMARALFDAGADVITLGNHAWDRKELIPYIAENPRLIRPLNFPPGTPGAGITTVTLADGRRVAVMNVMGRLFMDALDCPFRLSAQELAKYKLGSSVAAIVVDFHAEATSEKWAYAHSFDGQVSLVVGTHTHSPIRRSSRACGRYGVPIRRGYVRRLRQRDRHGQAGCGVAVLAQDAGREAGAGRWRGHHLRGAGRDRRHDRAGSEHLAGATGWPFVAGHAAGLSWRPTNRQ